MWLFKHTLLVCVIAKEKVSDAQQLSKEGILIYCFASCRGPRVKTTNKKLPNHRDPWGVQVIYIIVLVIYLSYTCMYLLQRVYSKGNAINKKVLGSPNHKVTLLYGKTRVKTLILCLMQLDEANEAGLTGASYACMVSLKYLVHWCTRVGRLCVVTALTCH